MKTIIIGNKSALYADFIKMMSHNFGQLKLVTFNRAGEYFDPYLRSISPELIIVIQESNQSPINLKKICSGSQCPVLVFGNNVIINQSLSTESPIINVPFSRRFGNIKRVIKTLLLEKNSARIIRSFGVQSKCWIFIRFTYKYLLIDSESIAYVYKVNGLNVNILMTRKGRAHPFCMPMEELCRALPPAKFIMLKDEAVIHINALDNVIQLENHSLQLHLRPASETPFLIDPAKWYEIVNFIPSLMDSPIYTQARILDTNPSNRV